MSKQITFTNGFMTGISGSELSSSTDANKYTFVNGLCTDVTSANGLARNQIAINFVNGLAVSTGSFTSGSVTPPPPPVSGSVLYMSGSSIKAYVDLTNEPEFIDVDFGDFTWEGWYWPEETTLYDPNYYHGGILVGKSWPGTPIDFGWNVGWGIYSSAPYTGKIMFSCLASTTFKTGGTVYLQVIRLANNFGPPYPPIDSTLWLNNWHHIAFTDKHTFSDGYTVATLRTLWLDGVKIIEHYYASYSYANNGETDAFQKTTLLPVHLTAGYQFNVDPAKIYTQMKQGWMRLSNTVRYSTTFTPIDRLSPPSSDGNTLGLWYATEGTGNIIYNYQGDSDRNGTAYNTDWIAS